jgi:outer membrane receptor protein involved in Fe transport
VSDTLTLGVVIQPRFVPRLAITVDWFDIQIDNAVSQIGADTIVGICTDTADPFFCGLVNRDQFGSLWRTSNGFVRNLTQNIGGIGTRGVDIGASYAMDIGSWGNVGFNFQGTWLDELVTDTGVSGEFDCVGLYGNVCGTPNPEWRHTARVTFQHPDGYGLSLRWRHFGSVTLDALDENPNLNDPSGTGPAPGGVARPALARIGSQNYLDLAATFRVGDHFNFRLGVNNLLDRDPPITPSQACPPPFCSGNAWANVYDSLGRYIYAGVTLNF